MADRDLIQLIDAHLDGLIAPDDFAALSEFLRTDPEAARTFARRSADHRNLRQMHTATPTPAAVTPASNVSDTSHIAHRTSNIRIAIYSLAAALLLTAAAVAIYVFAFSNPQSEIRDPKSAGPAIATLIESTGTVLANNDIAHPGSEYAAGFYSIESGSAQFLLDSRVTVDLQGRTRLRMHNPMSASLESGSASFNCPPGSEGFTVALPRGARVVDLGTRFDVRVRTDGKAAVSVTEGSVRIERDEQQYVLSADQTATVVDGVVTVLPRPVETEGDAVYLATPPDAADADSLRRDAIQVILERADWAVPSQMIDGVVMVEAGSQHRGDALAAMTHGTAPAPIAPGQPVDVYLVRFAPTSNSSIARTATVRMPGPIVGFVAQDQARNALLNSIDPSTTSEELLRYGLNEQDRVELKSDGRSLGLRMLAWSGGSDNLIVLVEARPGPAPDVEMHQPAIP